MTPRKKLRDSHGTFATKVSLHLYYPVPWDSVSPHVADISFTEPDATCAHLMLTTAELLEAVLLALPTEDLLLHRECASPGHSSATRQSASGVRSFWSRQHAAIYIDWRVDDKCLYSGGRSSLDLGHHLRVAHQD